MILWLAGRLVQSAFTFVALVVLVFVLARISGDPAALLVPFDAPPGELEATRERLGLDKSIPEQFIIYAGNIAEGDFGDSIRSRRPSLELVLGRVEATLKLAVAGLALALVIAIPLGVLTALRPGSFLDAAIRAFAVLGLSVPNFVAAILLISLLSVQFDVLPPIGEGGIEHMIMPSFSLAIFPLAGLVRLVRASLLESLDSSYVKFAKLKGLSTTQIMLRHALPNTLVPVVSFIGVSFAAFLSGVIVVETIFAWPGIGSLSYQALSSRDFPVLQTVVICIGGAVIFLNLFLDAVSAFLDPRIRVT